MKKILFLFVLLLSFGVSATNEPAVESSYLFMSGDISIKEKTTIMVFIYDTVECNWSMIEKQEVKKNYELLLIPTESYQVWFQSPNGYSRIVYIDPGDAGTWNARLSINFDPESLAFIHMYQTCSEQGLGRYYAEFMNSKKQAEEELPATNCIYCDDDWAFIED
jgi:hypothetical protein